MVEIIQLIGAVAGMPIIAIVFFILGITAIWETMKKEDKFGMAFLAGLVFNTIAGGMIWSFIIQAKGIKLEGWSDLILPMIVVGIITFIEDVICTAILPEKE